MANGVVVSVIMPTLNSARTLRIALASVRAQQFPQDAIEILVADGGSTDGTLEIAREYGCEILENHKVLPEYAKSLGLMQARGRYAVFLDSDEEILDRHSFAKKVELLDAVGTVHSVITAGLRTPEGYSVVSDYANRFGDPFSYFMYRLDGGDYERSFRANVPIVHETADALVFQFPQDRALPICDGGGHFFRLMRLREVADTRRPDVASQVFNIMAAEHRQLAVVKGDFVRHYSTATVRGLMRKINWRVVGNVHYAASGVAGHSARESGQPVIFARRKFAFVPYAATLVGPLIDAATLSIRYRSAGFMVHLPLAVYTLADIAWQMALKAAGRKPRWQQYGS